MTAEPDTFLSRHSLAADSVRVQLEGSVLRLTLERPDRLNALNPGMVRTLRDIFQALYWDNLVRVVVLSGAGRTFCAGLDLGQLDRDEAERGGITQMLTRQRSLAEVYVAMRRCPQPIIACVQGAASGGGLALALASDIRLLADDARMNAAFIRIGLSACDMGVSYFLPRMIGISRASRYMLTGRFMDAGECLSTGLASEVCPASGLRSLADEYAEDMLRATPLGLRLTKDVLNFTLDAPGLESVMALEDRSQMLAVSDPDFKEGLSAFLEKRRPVYD